MTNDEFFSLYLKDCDRDSAEGFMQERYGHAEIGRVIEELVSAGAERGEALSSLIAVLGKSSLKSSGKRSADSPDRRGDAYGLKALFETVLSDMTAPDKEWFADIVTSMTSRQLRREGFDLDIAEHIGAVLETIFEDPDELIGHLEEFLAEFGEEAGLSPMEVRGLISGLTAFVNVAGGPFSGLTEGQKSEFERTFLRIEAVFERLGLSANPEELLENWDQIFGLLNEEVAGNFDADLFNEGASDIWAQWLGVARGDSTTTGEDIAKQTNDCASPVDVAEHDTVSVPSESARIKALEEEIAVLHKLYAKERFRADALSARLEQTRLPVPLKLSFPKRPMIRKRLRRVFETVQGYSSKLRAVIPSAVDRGHPC